ncbi:MAG: hypothetical protein J6Y02_06610 [Pseudobutyrivibrio sp.]|nr:hypothetical protein [Pseudobutyrivibrio sp.]
MSFKVKRNTIFLTRGDTFKAHLSINNPDGSVYTPVEGDTVRFALKENIEDQECLIFKNIPIDTMLLVLDPQDTKELEFGTYVYDIQLTKANGDVDTFITASKLKLTAEVD